MVSGFGEERGLSPQDAGAKELSLPSNQVLFGGMMPTFLPPRQAVPSAPQV